MTNRLQLQKAKTAEENMNVTCRSYFFTVKITQILLKQAKYLLFQFLKKVDLIVSSVIHERCTRRNKIFCTLVYSNLCWCVTHCK